MSISPFDALGSSRFEPASARSLVTSAGSERFRDHFQPQATPRLEPPRREPQFATTESPRSNEQEYDQAGETTSFSSEPRTDSDSTRHADSTRSGQEVSRTEKHDAHQDSSGENPDQVTLSPEAEQTREEEAADTESLDHVAEVNAPAVESTPAQLEPIEIAEESTESEADLVTSTLPAGATPDQQSAVEPTLELTAAGEPPQEATPKVAANLPTKAPATETGPAATLQKSAAAAKTADPESSATESLATQTAVQEQQATAASQSDKEAATKLSPGGELKQALPRTTEETAEESSESKPATSTDSSERSDRSRRNSRKTSLAESLSNQTTVDRKAVASSQPANVARVDNVAIEQPASTLLDSPAVELSIGETTTETSSLGKAESVSTQATGERSQGARFAEKLITQSATRHEGSAEVRHVDQARFVQRVAGAFARASQRDGELRLRLSPPELGSLKLQLKIEEGAMTARLEAESSAARSLLLENLPSLRERLAEQNIRVERFEVELQQHSQTSTGSDQQSNRQTNGNASSGKQTQGTAQQNQVESDNEPLPASIVADKQINIVV